MAQFRNVSLIATSILRTRRKHLNWSIRKVSELAKMDPSQYLRMENGTTDPQLSTWLRAIHAMGLELHLKNRKEQTE